MHSVPDWQFVGKTEVVVVYDAGTSVGHVKEVRSLLTVLTTVVVVVVGGRNTGSVVVVVVVDCVQVVEREYGQKLGHIREREVLSVLSWHPIVLVKFP